jgi:LPXTG-motif cell wall-anchored protein
VRAASTKGRLPLVALLVGGAALGGVLFWFTRKRRRG